MYLLILNGPNLNLLGRREPAIYGSQSFDSYLSELRQDTPCPITYLQSNHEGDLIDAIQQHGYAADCLGIVLNAGGYTHTSIAIRDAVAAIPTPVVEVHLTDISQREPFRRHSYLSDVVRHRIMGHGLEGYREAIQWLIQNQ